MGSVCGSRRSLDLDVSSNSLPKEANEEKPTNGRIELAGPEESPVQVNRFFPAELPKSEHQRRCQDVLGTLEPLKSQADKLKSTASLLASWRQKGILQKIHSYVNAISVSSPSFEELSVLLVDKSSPYLLALRRPYHELATSYAIYYWVAKNIEYNVDEWNQMTLNSSNPPIVSPEHVFKRRSSVCSGYANLYRALGLKAGLKVAVVDGHVKRTLSDRNEIFYPSQRNNHAWNAVSINGAWYLIDCTFGAGTVDRGCFIKKYNDSYFAISPDQLILTHWPDLEQWQLLETPVTLNDMMALIVLTPDTLQLGISLDACEILHVTSCQTPLASVQIEVPSKYGIIGTLTGLKQQQEYNQNVFVNRRNDNEYTVYVAPPAMGSYCLRIFVQDFSTPDAKITYCTSYLVCCEVESTEYIGFPQVSPETAYRTEFQLLHWTKHQSSNAKPHLAECVTGKLVLHFKAHPEIDLSHFISPGYFKCESSTQRYNYYTSLTQDSINPSMYTLNVVFPMEGLWSVCIMQRDALNKIFDELLMFYQVNVKAGIISKCTYPWIQSSVVSVLHNGPLKASGRDVFVLPFAVKGSMEFHALSVKSDSSQREEYEQYVNIVSQEDKTTQKLLAVFPEPGKWTVTVFYRPENSSAATSFDILFSCYMEIEGCMPNTIFPIPTQSVITPLKMSILDPLPLRYSDGQIFSVQIMSLESSCFDVKVIPTWSSDEIYEKSDTSIYDHCACLVPCGKENGYNLQAVFLEPGHWSIILLAGESIHCAMQKAFVFKVHIENLVGPTQLLFPKLYPAFYSSQMSLPSSHFPYQYRIYDKFSFSFTFKSEPDFNVVIFEDGQAQDQYNSQAIIRPGTESDEYLLEAVFPKEGNWIMQIFTGSISDYQPLLQLYTCVEIGNSSVAYPWIHPAFFKVYEMTLQLPPDFLLPKKLFQHEQFSLKLVRPKDVDILHQAKHDNNSIIDGVTSLLQTDRDNEYQLSANFTSPGQWTVLLYVSKRGHHDNWDLIFVHNIIVC